MALASGTRLGGYEILSLIGQGSMGEVYRARDSRLNRDVAIKVLPAEVAADHDRLARCEREAQVLASLNHPNIARIHGLEYSSGTPALVMELVDGPTLADRIAKGPIPLNEALPIAKQIAEALEAAHEQGIIHHGLKPANVKVSADGTAKVLDFGLANAFDPVASGVGGVTMSPTLSIHETQARLILGTAPYMAPEQARGKAADRRSDIWAFGCVLYEMVTGRKAFEGKRQASVNSEIMHADPPPLSAVQPLTPPLLADIVNRCLAKNPDDRWQNAAEIARDLAWLAETNSVPSAASPGQSSTNVSDESSFELLERVRRGDETALDRLLARHLPRLRYWASRRLPGYARDRGDTEDLVQETLIQALRRIKDFNPRREGALQAYLRQAVLNRIRDAIRRAKRGPAIERLDEQVAAADASPLERAIGSEALSRYDAALARLRPNDREAIIARMELGYDYDELAKLLGKPSRDAARLTVHRAMLRLAERMKDARR
jgi:RNA polymerase sigma factor (sigma-70 family)